DALFRHQFAQYALPQAAIGNAQPLGWPDKADRLENGASRQYQIGPVSSDAGVGGALVEIPGQQLLDHAVHAIAIHPQAVHLAAVELLQFEMDTGKGGSRTGRTQKGEARPGANMVQRVAPLETIEPAPDDIDNALECFAGHIAPAIAL